MLNRIRKYITERRLLDKNTIHIVALSGGADSVCLLRVMLELGYKVHAAHCNFNLRGEESVRDEKFCIALCKELGVELHRTHFDTKQYATLHKVSIEMAARQLRYSYFEQLRLAIEADDIVVAHHRDDNVETVLMNMMRGTGLKGMIGIRPQNGVIKRPLLCISRQDIEDYLTLKHQPYITDSSNLVDDVTRNKIRLNLIPLMQSINPSAVQNIANMIANLEQVENVTEDAIATSTQRCCKTSNEITEIDISCLMREAAPELTLFSILSTYNFTSGQTKQIFDNITTSSGRTWSSVTHTLATDRKRLLIAPNETLGFCCDIKIPEDGTYILYNNVKMQVLTKEITSNFSPSREANLATLDAAKVRFPLRVRKTKSGDRFAPFGMKGTKLVSDYMTDCKLNFIEKSRQLVVEDAQGHIVWLVGRRVSQKSACRDNTIKTLTLRFFSCEL